MAEQVTAPALVDAGLCQVGPHLATELVRAKRCPD